MALFRRRRSDDAPPDWSPITDPEDWERFAQLASEETERRGWSGDVREGEVTDGEGRYFLHNIAQACGQSPVEEWPQMLRDHFKAVDATADFRSPDEARAALKARLVDDEYLAPVDWEVAARRVAEDLQLVLAYDLPETVIVPRREEVLELGDEDELFTLALDRVRLEPGLELERQDVQVTEDGETVPIFMLVGDSFFTATHALWADGFDPPPSELGTLLAVPTRHIVLAHPIRGTEVIGAVNALVALADQFEGEGPGSISSNLYWLRDGELQTLRAWADEEGTHFVPSPDFVEMLEGLVG
jgi:hypothetical protein